MSLTAKAGKKSGPRTFWPLSSLLILLAALSCSMLLSGCGEGCGKAPASTESATEPAAAVVAAAEEKAKTAETAKKAVDNSVDNPVENVDNPETVVDNSGAIVDNSEEIVDNSDGTVDNRGDFELPPFDLTAPVLNEVYPNLSTGVLVNARLVDLPEDLLVRSELIQFRQADLDKQLEVLPENVREKMTDSALFLVEQLITSDFLLEAALKDHLISGQNDAGAEPGAGLDLTVALDSELDLEKIAENYLEKLLAAVEVTDEEVKQFYEDNPETFKGAPLMFAEGQIRAHLEREAQQHLINTHLAGLGITVPIEVSADWIEHQSISAVNNPVDQARSSGKPSFVSFGADSCVPCQMMKPVRAEIEEKYGERINHVYIHADQEQVLAARYRVRGIPYLLFLTGPAIWLNPRQVLCRPSRLRT